MNTKPLITFGEVETSSLEQIRRCLEPESAVWGVLCADHHKGYSMPIGGVVAYRNAVSPSGVGYDISCGVRASRTSLFARDIRSSIDPIMDRIASEIEFGIGRTTGTISDHELFDDPTWQDLPDLGKLKRMAALQLGTVGSGNHFVDLLEDEDGWLWVMVHFGSRGFGHKTATGFLNLAHGIPFDGKPKQENMDASPTLLSLSSSLGQDYWQAMKLAGRYAYAGRDIVVQTVLDILGTWAQDTIHNNHNFAWKEIHNGEELVVVRKGATPNAPGQVSAVGSSMGDISVIVEGLNTTENNSALYSTVHGAGRVMSRTQAAGKRNWKTGGRSGGKITPTMMLDWLRKEGVTLRGAGTDEAPQAYKRLPEVLKYHEGSTGIVRTLKPIGVAMAGGDLPPDD